MIFDKFRNMLQFYKPKNIHLKMTPPPKTLKFKCDVIFYGLYCFYNHSSHRRLCLSEYVIIVSIFPFLHMFLFLLQVNHHNFFAENNTDWAPSLKLGHSKFTTNVKSSEEREKRRKNRELNKSQNIKSQKRLFPKSPYQSTTEPNEEISATDFVQFEVAHQTESKISESTGNNGCQTDLTGEGISSMKQELERSTNEIYDLKQEVLSI